MELRRDSTEHRPRLRRAETEIFAGQVRLAVHTKQAKSDSPVRSKERNTGEHREPQADIEQQGWETPPHKPGPPAGLRELLERALEVGGPGRCPLGQRLAERGGRAVKAPPGRTPAVRAWRASAAGSEELEAATDVGRRRDAPRPVHRA